jgi:hypothetical protein
MNDWPKCPKCYGVIEYNIGSPENEYVCPYCKAALKFEKRNEEYVLTFRRKDLC